MTALAFVTAQYGEDGSDIDRQLWPQMQRKLVAKALSELAYEEIFVPTRTADNNGWLLTLGSGVRYRFQGAERIWGNISVDPATIERTADNGSDEEIDIFRFVADARAEIAMVPADLAWYLRELQNTSIADHQLAALNAEATTGALADMPEMELHARLEGHPKAVTSKGRIGWGMENFRSYAPEFGSAFQLIWLAVSRDIMTSAQAAVLSDTDLFRDAMSESEIERLRNQLATEGVPEDEYALVPVHPWQWDNVISQWFAEDLAKGRILLLGAAGDRFRPQPSLRTLTNTDRNARYDIKLSLSILNTSCYRGIPGRYIPVGPRLSDWLADLVDGDAFLSQTHRTVVLREFAGSHVDNATFKRIEDLPYRYHEGLGVIWRERLDAKLKQNERAVMLSALHHCDANGRPLLAEYIERSGMTPAAWLTKLFDEVTIPLYHFLCRHGVSFIAHGQNISVVLHDWIPAALVVKDFQGDLDLIDRPFEELESLPEDIRRVLPRKRPEVIIHNIQTGHFVTVMRFVSDAAEACGLMKEADFYRLLAERLRTYQRAHPDLKRRFDLLDLFAPKIPRVCLNKARFEIGYADSSQRPTPAVGNDLNNPLYRFDKTSDRKV